VDPAAGLKESGRNWDWKGAAFEFSFCPVQDEGIINESYGLLI
jgi:hypothetical protein